MSTFSQLVDSLCLEIVRPDMLSMIPGYLNQTIRELHIDASSDGMPVLYKDNMIEDSLVVANVTQEAPGFVWQIPRLNRFQAMGAVFYPSRNRYASEKRPDVAKLTSFTDVNRDLYWYRSGINIVFSGHGGNTKSVLITYYEYCRNLVYYIKTNRPVTWNAETDQLEYNNTVINAMGITQAEALDRTTNWLILRHADCLMEGVRAKAYKRMSDMERARLCYSQFESMRLGVIKGESTNANAAYAR